MATTLRRLRESRGLTQAQLARRAKVSQPLISRTEAGHVADLSLTTALRLAKALGVDVTELAK